MEKDPDLLTKDEKIQIGLKTIEDFFDQFGGENDIYKQIFLEELVKFMFQEIKKPK